MSKLLEETIMAYQAERKLAIQQESELNRNLSKIGASLRKKSMSDLIIHYGDYYFLFTSTMGQSTNVFVASERLLPNSPKWTQVNLEEPGWRAILTSFCVAYALE